MFQIIGVSNFLIVFFRDPDNVNLLIERVEEIYASFTPDKMTSRLKPTPHHPVSND